MKRKIMNKKNKTQEELNNEIKLLRKRITELEKLDPASPLL